MTRSSGAPLSRGLVAQVWRSMCKDVSDPAVRVSTAVRLL